MVVIECLVVLDSESVLVSTNMLMNRESSSAGHSRSDLESLTIWKWLFGVAVCFLVDEPSLVESIVAVVEDHISSVGVGF